jgi:ribosome-associated translation inhibitor RaiA
MRIRVSQLPLPQGSSLTSRSRVDQGTNMRLMVHGHNVEITPDLYSYVERRLQATLGAFATQVGRVTVGLQAPVGAEDAITTCHILVELHASGGLRTGEAAPEPETAIDRAAERAGRAVRRELARCRGLTDGAGTKALLVIDDGRHTS